MGDIAHMPFGPWGSLAYFAGIGAVLLAAALVVANRRDA
jgi:ABC-2 type transport system permease protein